MISSSSVWLSNESNVAWWPWTISRRSRINARSNEGVCRVVGVAEAGFLVATGGSWLRDVGEICVRAKETFDGEFAGNAGNEKLGDLRGLEICVCASCVLGADTLISLFSRARASPDLKDGCSAEVPCSSART